jgi:hypothetical protein
MRELQHDPYSQPRDIRPGLRQTRIMNLQIIYNQIIYNLWLLHGFLTLPSMVSQFWARGYVCYRLQRVIKLHRESEREREREMKTKTKKCSTENTTRHLLAQELHTQPVYYVNPGATNYMPFRSFSRTESLKNKPVSCTTSKCMYAHRRNFCRCFTIQLQS